MPLPDVMKKMFILILVSSFVSIASFAQSQYETLPDGKTGGKIFKGIISLQVLQSEPSFSWYNDNLKGYAPNKDAIAGLKKHADSIELVVFMGTWCDDSHYIVPKFYTLLNAAGFPNDKVTLIGVDRDKNTLSHLSQALNVVNVPTIIVMKKGKEMGRVVEYGKYGLFDKELAEILTGIQ